MSKRMAVFRPGFTYRIAFAIVSVASCACSGTVGDEIRRPGNDTSPGGQGASAGGSPQWGNAAKELPEPAAIATTRFPRLTHFEWENTVADLIGNEDRTRITSIARMLKRDAVSGFDNQNDNQSLSIDGDLRGDYERAAEAIAEWVASDATALARMVSKNGNKPGDRDTFIQQFGARAYRRPLSTDEQNDLGSLFDKGASLFGSGNAFNDGVRLMVTLALQSPLFLYRPELGQAGSRLSPHELASRLSYALTGTMPDAMLMTAAADGTLSDQATLLSQASRLLATPASRRLVEHVHHQLYALSAFDGIRKDNTVFPEFDVALPGLLQRETLAFLDGVVADGGGLSEILLSRKVWLDRRTAALYGVAGSFSDTPSENMLDSNERAGLLTRLGILATYADARNPDPIHRGVFISRAILCRTLPPPADNVTPVPTSGGTTNRERVHNHTGPGTCGASCHATIINPLGFALEEYDAMGKFRSTDNGKEVDASGTYDFGDGEQTFQNAREFSERLAGSQEAHACYASQWFSYLWGRRIDDADLAFLDAKAQQSVAGLGLVDLVAGIVGSNAFATRAP